MIIRGAIPNIGEIAREDGRLYCRFQRNVFRTHRVLRQRALEMAAEEETDLVLVLYDRGELDGMAYHNHDCWENLASEFGTTIAEIRDSYLAVLHLETTANGAEEFYSRANNSARWDDLNEARRFDAKIFQAWRGHPQQILFDNSTDWDGKRRRLLATILRIVGVEDTKAKNLLGRSRGQLLLVDDGI